jgi:hypothetical protein
MMKVQYVTDCCQSASILQDAYTDPNHNDEVVNTFDDYVCDNVDCDNYGQACSCDEVAVPTDDEESK